MDKGLRYGEVVDIVSETVGVSTDEAASKVNDHLEALQYDHEDVSFADDMHPHESSTPHLAAVEITRKCNLECVYCYAGSSPEQTATMPLARTKEVFDKLADAGIPQTWITGGEPMAHPKFGEIIRAASERGLYTVVATNGTPLAFNDDYPSLVEEYVDEIQITIDGPTAETHTALRGTGFDYVVEGVENIVSIAESTIVTVGTTLCDTNIDHIEGIVNLAADLGADVWAFAPMIPMGRGKENTGLELSPEQMVEAHQKVDQLQADREDIGVMSVMVGLSTLSNTKSSTARCSACNYKIFIHPGVETYPCIFLRQQEHKLGNILEEPLEQILSTSRAKYFIEDVDNSDADTPYDMIDEECKSCILMKEGVCNAYCKAVPKESYCTKHIEESPLHEKYVEFTN